LKTNPGRFNSLYGAASAAAAVGKNEKAHDYYAQIVKNCADSQSERSELKRAREEMDRLARSSALLFQRVFPAGGSVTPQSKAVTLNFAPAAARAFTS
jgi:hypothetical protein